MPDQADYTVMLVQAMQALTRAIEDLTRLIREEADERAALDSRVGSHYRENM